MLPKARPRSTRRFGWPFRRRRNRRVRGSFPSLTPPDGVPVLPPQKARPPRPPLWKQAGALVAAWRRPLIVIGVGAALAGAGWAARWYLTHARHFALTAVRVSPTRHVSAEALIARAGVPLGINLFAVDRDAVARAVSRAPWVARVHVRRELPSTLVLDVVERQAACSVALGSLYLSDADGDVFKRATPAEAAALPVVTGIGRDDYVDEPDKARTAIRQALAAVQAWRARGDRPPLGEAHVDRMGAVTLYTDRGVGVRIGGVDATIGDRLHRFDVVAAALQKSGEEARLIYVDNRARPDRVTVKLASAQLAAHSGSGD
jgi:cell division protein FtsQ